MADESLLTNKDMVLKGLFNTPSDYINNNPNEAYRNSGYLTQGVKKSNVFKVGEDVVRFFRQLDPATQLVWELTTDPVNTIVNSIKNPIGTIKGILKKFGRGGKTTRYYYIFVQNVNQINGQYLPDPISTYAGIAVANKQDVAQYVQERIKTGKGYDLKKYYQYSKRRYRNRQMDWKAYQSVKLSNQNILFNQEGFEATLPIDRKFRLVSTDMSWDKATQRYQWQLQNDFGVDFFNQKDYEKTEPLDEYEAIGVTYWSAPIEPIEKKEFEWGIGKADNIPQDLANLKPNQTTVFTAFVFNQNPYNLPHETSTSNKPEKEEEMPANVEWVVKAKITYLGLKPQTDGSKKHEYKVNEIHEIYDYDQEHFFWIDKQGGTNSEELLANTLIKPLKQIFSEPETNENSTAYRFYSQIPIRDWVQGKWNIIQTLPDMAKHQELLKSMAELNSLSEKLYEGSEELIEADSVKGKRTQEKVKKNKPNKSKERKLQREITRDLQRSRRIKVFEDKLADKKKYRPSRLKKHLEILASYLGLDYNQYVAQQMASKTWEGGYESYNTFHSSILPAVIFSNQSSENMDYWYQWAKNEYRIQGKEESKLRWLRALDSATSINQLPQNIVRFNTTDKTFSGGFSYLFIEKFTITGSIRDIKRKRRYKDILRGRSRTIANLQHLKAVKTPYKELAKDKYYTSKNGKQYPVGGAKYNGTGITESNEPEVALCLDNFSYTFFCKSSGSNEITCYAICGLQFHTKAHERNFWCMAWKDLDMEFQRLRERYIERKAQSDIQVYHELETGGRKYYYVNRLYNFGIVPVDYNVIRRMSARSLENFASRAPLNYSWLFVEQKKKRKGIKYVKPVVQIVGFIVSIILTPFTGGQSLWINVAIQIAFAVAVSVIIKLVMNYVLMPLLKALGLKGIVALIIMIIIIVIVAVLTGNGNIDSVMPMASDVATETANQVGNQVAQEAVKEATKEFTMEAIKETLSQLPKQFIQEAIGENVVQMGTKAIGYATEAYNQVISEQMNEVQRSYKEELQAFNKAFEELEEMKEQLQATQPKWDTRAIMAQYANPQKFKDLDLVLESQLTDLGQSLSLDYIWNVLDMKTTINPITYDPIESTKWKI